MQPQAYDIIVEIDSVLARLRALTPEAREWIETHVTLAQVQTWTGNTLEVAPHYIGDLIAGVLRAGLKISTAYGRSGADSFQYGNALFMTFASQN